jgi:peptide/nickel transport system permease protein
MIRYLLRRLLWSAATLAGMSVVAFLLVALAPGDPILAELRFLGVPAKPDTIAALREQFDLDAPLPERYLRWAARLVTMNLGNSIASGRPVSSELVQALPPTLILAVVSLALIVLLSSVTGVLASLYPRGALARLLRGLTVASVSVPLYWLALAAVFLGSVTFGIGSFVDPSSFGGLALAATLLSFGPGMSVSRIVQQRIDAERVEDYVRLAAATGQSPARILFEDIGRVVAPSLITIWANSFGYLLGGAVVIERIFDRPGLGNLALQAVAARDYPVLQAYLMLAGLLFVCANWAADALSAWVDPRLRRRGIHA